MIYLYALVHKIFILIFYFIWKKLNIRRLKKASKEFTFSNLFIAFILGCIFDILGYIFGLWFYESSNILEYADIAFSTWILGAPIMLAVYIDFKEILSKIKVKIKSFEISRGKYILMFLISSSVFIVVGFNRFLNMDTPAAPEFFVIMLIAGILAEETLLGILKVENMFDNVSKGEIFSLFTILIAGFLTGFLWEVLNVNFRLWTFTNLPPVHIFGMDFVAIVLFGLINYTYYNFSMIYHKFSPEIKLFKLKKK